MSAQSITGKAVAVEGCDQACFMGLDGLFRSKGSVLLTHFVSNTGFVVFQEEAEADVARGDLNGYNVDTVVLTTRRPTATEDDLLGQMLRVKRLEELVVAPGIESHCRHPGTSRECKFCSHSTSSSVEHHSCCGDPTNSSNHGDNYNGVHVFRCAGLQLCSAKVAILFRQPGAEGRRLVWPVGPGGPQPYPGRYLFCCSLGADRATVPSRGRQPCSFTLRSRGISERHRTTTWGHLRDCGLRCCPAAIFLCRTAEEGWECSCMGRTLRRHRFPAAAARQGKSGFFWRDAAQQTLGWSVLGAAEGSDPSQCLTVVPPI